MRLEYNATHVHGKGGKKHLVNADEHKTPWTSTPKNSALMTPTTWIQKSVGDIACFFGCAAETSIPPSFKDHQRRALKTTLPTSLRPPRRRETDWGSRRRDTEGQVKIFNKGMDTDSRGRKAAPNRLCVTITSKCPNRYWEDSNKTRKHAGNVLLKWWIVVPPPIYEQNWMHTYN